MSPRDPLTGFFCAGLSAAHYFAGRYNEAIKWARQGVQLRPGMPAGHRMLCASLAQAGLLDEARSAGLPAQAATDPVGGMGQAIGAVHGEADGSVP